jgi:hypothetical protein
LSVSDKNEERFSPNSSLLGIYTMLGLILIYLFHGMNRELLKLGFPTYYEFPILNATLSGFLLGLVNFMAISFFVDQAIRKKDRFRKIANKFAAALFSGEKPKEHDVYARLTATVCAMIYFVTCITALLLTPGGMNASFIILIWGLGIVMSISTWMKILLHHYQLNQINSIDRLKMNHATWLELVRQFILCAVAGTTGVVIYGVVNWGVIIPQSVAFSFSFQITVFSLAAVTIYLITGFVLGVISPSLIFLEKMGGRIEEIADIEKKNACANKS